jgi:hypothetical protein
MDLRYQRIEERKRKEGMKKANITTFLLSRLTSFFVSFLHNIPVFPFTEGN